ncbi:MAG TPA: hypothetical protein DFI00_06195 [Rhodospirillaceae bacterium]|nr:hypothetical protein [Alphaproteobacteria bacterium]OUT41965.1 MAG: hypothetical protein CBB62_06560 [Micavibrio sp. TMED2]HCI46865.1 hypothetical protein [Rhodospirillaceae bacterium]MAS46439.1 hypothetical protein [Alphaproteobacteria bacterium]MAX94534.1 hypothetical protein [Alphaproteobacteria bacterium]|tara:strand:- start:7968 stop:9128 length:1161 start_codon:yes stop_codon:yes gene_type:complete
MSNLGTRNNLLLTKIESTPGTFETMAATADAIAVEGLNPPTPNAITIPDNSAQASLDGLGTEVGGMTMQTTFTAKLKGSGSAGVAPELGTLLRICGYREVVVAAAVPVSPEACAAAGGSQIAAVLGASASATADAYLGMPVEFSGDSSGIGHIIDYTSGKVATLAQSFQNVFDDGVDYQILPAVAYLPSSTAIPAASLRQYHDGVHWDLTGVRGNVSFAWTAGQTAVATFTLNGMFHDKGDLAVPSDAVFDSVRAPIWKNGEALLDRSAVAINEFSVDTGIQGAFDPNPNQLEGFDPYVHTQRLITGSIDPNASLVATRDAFADFRGGTERIFLARAGAVAGNRVAMMVPKMRYQNVTPGDRSGRRTDQISFEAIGQDNGIALVVY